MADLTPPYQLDTDTSIAGSRLRGKIITVAASDTPKVGGLDFVCSGTDDHLTIIKALNTLGSGGGTVRLLSGTYNFNGTVALSGSNLTIEGAGESTVIRYVAGAPVDKAMFGLTGANRVTIRRIKLDGNKANNSGNNQRGVSIFNDASNVLLEDILFENVSSYGILMNGCSDVHIERCGFDGNHFDGIQAFGAAIRVTVKSCWFRSQGDSIDVSPNGTAVPKRWVVTGNDFIQVSFDHFEWGGDYLILSNNFFDGAGDSDIEIESGTAHLVANNHCRAPGGTSIEDLGSEGCVYSNNTLYLAGTSHGMELAGTNSSVVGNYAYTDTATATFAAIICYGSDITVSGNTVWGSWHEGIRNATAAYRCGILGNSIFDASTPIVDSGNQSRIFNNNLSGAGTVVGSWQTPTLLNSWVQYGGGYSVPRYRKDVDGTVYIEAMITGGTAGTMFNLPAGYRPSSHHIFNCYSAGGSYRLDVKSTGDVVMFGTITAWHSVLVSFNIRDSSY